MFVIAPPSNVYIFLRKDEPVQPGHTMECYIPFHRVLGVESVGEALNLSKLVLSVGTVFAGIGLTGDAVQWFRVVQRVYDAEGDLMVYVEECQEPGRKNVALEGWHVRDEAEEEETSSNFESVSDKSYYVKPELDKDDK